VVGRIPAAVDAARIEPTGEGNESKKKKSAAPKKMSKKASPTKSSWKEPQTGDIFEGAVVTSVKPTVAGGAKVFLKNGVMVVFDDKGTELMRTDNRQKAASPPALQVATDIAGESAPPPKEDVLSVPDEVMKTRMTRDVLKWLLDKGVTDRDQIIAECERLKQNGAVAFSTCPDVRQRASTVLTAMGVA
jgi:hypothetical protein